MGILAIYAVIIIACLVLIGILASLPTAGGC